MSDLSPILDYASPRKRQKLRLPARSRIRCQLEDERLVIVEKLEGRGEAISAVIFAVFMLVYLGSIVMFVRRGSYMAVFWFAEAAVLIAVIHQTWRKSELTVTPGKLRLKFTSPMWRKLYEWQGEEVPEVL